MNNVKDRNQHQAGAPRIDDERVRDCGLALDGLDRLNQFVDRWGCPLPAG